MSAGLLILALSSLSRNSRYVALFWLGIWFVGGVTSTILGSVEQEQRRHAMFREMNVVPRTHRQQANRPGRLQEDEEWMEAWRRAHDKYATEEMKAGQTDWRPLVSYTANLSRIGRQLLRTNAAWEEMSKLLPLQERPTFLMTFTSAKYPWRWSAVVLCALLGFSVWILNLQIKSLDRLK
jgi:ABC-2 type transport system permease protein